MSGEFFAGMEGLGEALKKKRQSQIDDALAVMLADEERRRRQWRARPGGGGASRPRPSGKQRRSLPGRGEVAFSHDRSSVAVKTALAAGGQAAVVKLASYASGKARMSALLGYQSHGGELQLEREDGSKIEGEEAIEGIAHDWSETSVKREPSKDIVMIHLTLPSEDRQRVGEVLASVLEGHKFAWRRREGEEGQRIEIVATAASRAKDEYGRAARLYDNRKSIEALQQRFASALPGAATEVRGFSHGVEGAARYLARLTDGGTVPAVTSTAEVLSGREANMALAKSWRRDMRSREQRDVAHIILSSKPGTDKQAFLDAGRATLAREFAGHEYVFALHENRQHLHIHAVVKMVDSEGKRLDPKIQDFKRWRETMAEEARERAILMEAPSRFESANPPGYKLKDIRRVERGVASEAVRRRVERVREREIHIPSRAEGIRKAGRVAGEWRALAVRPEPALRPGMVRLYRAEVKNQKVTGQLLFTAERRVAVALAQERGGYMSYVDVPPERRGEIRDSTKSPGVNFVVGAALARERQTLASFQKADILRFVSRAEAADKMAREREKGSIMPNIQNIEEARERVEAPLKVIESILGDRAGEEIRRESEKIRSSLDEALSSQKKIEPMSEVAGEGYIKPERKRFEAFVSHEKGTSIVYAHRREDGSAGKAAFIDQGHKVEVKDWRSQESTLAAMQLAAEKWKEGITIKGPAKYQEMAIKLAVEHDIKVKNPELQERLVQERERWREMQKTSFEPGINLALENVRERVKAEAERETALAAKGVIPEGEAAEARLDARTVETNARSKMSADLGDSPQMQSLVAEQRAILAEEGEASQRRDQKQKERPRGQRGG